MKKSSAVARARQPPTLDVESDLEVDSVEADSNGDDKSYVEDSEGCGDDDALSITSEKLELSDDEEYCVDCTPCVPNTFAGTKLSANGKCCQICYFEGRGVQQSNVVVCKAHRVRVCADVSVKSSPLATWLLDTYKVSIKSLKWICPDKDLTCWEKLHHYYVPNGLFPSLAQIKQTNLDMKKKEFFTTIKNSELYKSREKAIQKYEKRTGVAFDDNGKRKASSIESSGVRHRPSNSQKRLLSASEKKMLVVQEKERLKHIKDASGSSGNRKSSNATKSTGDVVDFYHLTTQYSQLTSMVGTLFERIEAMATASPAATEVDEPFTGKIHFVSYLAMY
jgi:hypothetical protein